MPKLSQWIEKLESRIERKCGKWLDRNKGKLWLYIILALSGLYFYGMFINSIRLGISSTFSETAGEIQSIWVVNPFRNIFAIFTPTGLATTGICFLLFCLITKKGYIWFSGYKFKRDPRGFDIIPDATHGSASFMERKEAEQVFTVGRIEDLKGNIYGKLKDAPDDDDRYADYVASNDKNGLNGNLLIYGAPGTGKSRGVIRPLIMSAVNRGESIIVVDPKGELFESMGGYLQDRGMTVKCLNLLDMVNSDGFNCLQDIEDDPDLVQTITATIIKNTSAVNERQDFWEKAESNLLSALIHYVQRQTVPGTNNLLPIQERSLGAIYRLLSDESFNSLEQRFAELPKGHPARAPYGIFKLANRQIWGNIAIGLGNRLSVFQNSLVDKITAYNDIDLQLPGQVPCAYFCIISDQDSSLEFLSSLFFSMLFSRLTSYARRSGGGRLPVTTNFVMDEFCNIGQIADFKRILSTARSRGINCQIVIQSLAQLADRYERREWEEVVGNSDQQVMLGCNDYMTADYWSKMIGVTSIRVQTNQMPLMPLFSPVYHSTRPYSQSSTNTQRQLMTPDEILRLDNRKCILKCRGMKPLELYKIVPEECPDYKLMRPITIADYIPAWRTLEEEAEKQPQQTQRRQEHSKPSPPQTEPESATEEQPEAPAETPPEQPPINDGWKDAFRLTYSVEQPCGDDGCETMRPFEEE